MIWHVGVLRLLRVKEGFSTFAALRKNSMQICTAGIRRRYLPVPLCSSSHLIWMCWHCSFFNWNCQHNNTHSLTWRLGRCRWKVYFLEGQLLKSKYWASRHELRRRWGKLGLDISALIAKSCMLFQSQGWKLKVTLPLPPGPLGFGKAYLTRRGSHSQWL